MKRITLLFATALVALSVSGCASLSEAGVASYRIAPLPDGTCCEVTVHNGKEIAVLDAVIEKTGDNYKVTLHEEGVVAFEGQRIAAGAAKTAASAAVKAAAIGGAVVAAPVIGAVAGTAAAAGTAGAVAVGAAGARAVDKLTAEPAQ